MKVKDILARKGTHVWTIQGDATVHEALGMFVTYHIGALVVLNLKEEIAGIISERDIIRECHRDSKDIENTPVHQVMTKKLIVGNMEDHLDYIMGIMTNNRIRHVPIIEDGHLKGVISIGDVVKSQLQDTEYENRYLKDYIFGRAA